MIQESIRYMYISIHTLDLSKRHTVFFTGLMNAFVASNIDYKSYRLLGR